MGGGYCKGCAFEGVKERREERATEAGYTLLKAECRGRVWESMGAKYGDQINACNRSS